MADYDPLMYAPHVAAAPPPPQQIVPQQNVPQQNVPQQNVPQQNNPPPVNEEPLFIGPQNLVGPRLPPIDDIVANDPEIRRICNELATLSNKLIGNYKENIVNIASGQLNSYHQPPFNQQQYKQPPLILEGWGNITENTLIQQIKYYVRMATNPDPNRRRSFNFQQAIDALQTTIRDNLNTKYNSAVQADNISRQNAMGFIQNPNANTERFWGTRGNVVLGAGSIGGIFQQIIFSTNYAGGPPINDVRRYCDLILQLYRRIQAILVENGFQQGGKKRRRQTKKRQTKKRKIKQTKKRKRRQTNKK